jgi:hypothetical protein
VAQALGGEPPAVDLAPFAPDRFVGDGPVVSAPAGKRAGAPTPATPPRGPGP